MWCRLNFVVWTVQLVGCYDSVLHCSGIEYKYEVVNSLSEKYKTYDGRYNL